MLRFIQQNHDYLTKEQLLVFTTIIGKEHAENIKNNQEKDKNFNVQNYVLSQVYNTPLYGSRKKNWSLLDDNVNAYNLYDIYEHVLYEYAQANASKLHKIESINSQLHQPSVLISDYNKVSLTSRSDRYNSSPKCLMNTFRSLALRVTSDDKVYKNQTILEFITEHRKPNKLWNDFCEIVDIANSSLPNQEYFETTITYLDEADLLHAIRVVKLEREYKDNHVMSIVPKVLLKYPTLMTLSNMFHTTESVLHGSWLLGLGYVHKDMTEDDTYNDTIAFKKMQLTQIIKIIKTIFK
jgi:regulator of sigma D